MTVLRFLAVYTVSILLAVIAVLVVDSQLSEQVKEVPLSAWSIFFGLNGFFFAVLIALLIAQLLRRFHRLNAVVRLEAAALDKTKQALRFLTADEPVEESIRADVRNYASAVVAVEWPEMVAQRRVRGDSGAMEELYDLLLAIRALELGSETDVIGRRMLIDGVVEVTSLRAERLHLSAESLSPIIRSVVLFLSTVIVGSFALVNVGELGMHIFMVITLGTAVSLLNLGLADLAQPLEGVWNVSSEPLREVARKFT